jgi:plasmid stability protein
MSTSIIIGEVPDEVREELAARAAVCGRTLEDYLREELMALAKRPSAAVWMARVRARKDALQTQNTRANGASHPASAHSDSEPPSAPRATEGPLLDARCDVG